VTLFIVCDPEVAFVPDQPSEAVQVVAFADSHEIATEDPAITSTVPDELLALSVIETAPPPDEDDEELLLELDEELVQF
jgi:hypothetical protein